MPKSRWTIPIPSVTLPTFLFGSPTSTELLESAPAYIDADRPERTITRDDFRLWSRRLAAGLQKAGLKKGEPVLLYSGNSIFFPVVILGVIMAGGIFTGANPNYNAREVAYQLTNSGARFLICAEASLSTGLAAAKQAGLPSSNIFVFDDDAYDGTGVSKSGCQHWSKLIVPKEEGTNFQWEESESVLDDTVGLNYSSGTTGLPKGVEITHRNYVSNCLQHGFLKKIQKGFVPGTTVNRWLAFTPMYHAMAQTYYAIMSIDLKIPVYMMKKFDFVKMLEYIQKYRITDLQMVPPIVTMLVKSPLTKKYDLSSVETAGSGAAPLGREVSSEFDRLWPPGKMNLKQGYGMSEMTCAALGWDPEAHSDSFGVGEPTPNCEVLVIDPDTGRELPQGQRGEVWVRGANVMKGYWKNQKATKETITPDGFLRTGDIAYVDENGIFFIVDRMKELIKVKGNQVAPAELEGQLLEHDSISDAAVVGVSIDGDEVPRAYCVVKPGSNISPEDVAKYMETKVSRHKRLSGGVKFVDAVLKNPSGKILRRLYREQAAREVGDSTASSSKL